VHRARRQPLRSGPARLLLSLLGSPGTTGTPTPSGAGTGSLGAAAGSVALPARHVAPRTLPAGTVATGPFATGPFATGPFTPRTAAAGAVASGALPGPIAAPGLSGSAGSLRPSGPIPVPAPFTAGAAPFT